MLELPDAWLWDFWIADTGEEYHLFFLRASRALQDPDRRHRRASVGHAMSSDLRTWTLAPDALIAADQPRWDDLAIWTGSVVDDGAGTWRMFYTALSHADDGRIQRIGVATSTDLITWSTRDRPLIEADARWYAADGDETRDEVFWRDPWVSRDANGDWQMLITARSDDRGVAGDDRGVLALATSPDLENWTVHPPVTHPGSGFLQLEVPQTAEVEGHGVLLFSCLGTELAEPRSEAGAGGSWVVDGPSPDGSFDVARATRLTDETYYSVRLVRDRQGDWQALGFVNRDTSGRFAGRLSDPMPVHRISSGQLSVRRN